MIKEIILVFMSGIFLGPYTFLGVSILNENKDHFPWLILAAFFGDIYSILFMYFLGYFLKNKIETKIHAVFGFFRIGQRCVNKAKEYVNTKKLLPLFLIIPFISHSIDGIVYLMCGLLGVRPLRFFYTVLIANIFLAALMILFGRTIKIFINEFLPHPLSSYSVIFIVGFIVVALAVRKFLSKK